MCVSFDLSSLITYSNNSFYKFVFHNGTLDNLDNNTKSKSLIQIDKLCNGYKLQYIFTIIKDDLPKNNKELIDQNIILTLDDSKEDEVLFEERF